MSPYGLVSCADIAPIVGRMRSLISFHDIWISTCVVR